ncbi:MAG: hypothetical protein LBS65_05485 [Desulfovibrio sp.]|nr:hypothetical protein [Desulfovibrio sp.]
MQSNIDATARPKQIKALPPPPPPPPALPLDKAEQWEKELDVLYHEAMEIRSEFLDRMYVFDKNLSSVTAPMFRGILDKLTAGTSIVGIDRAIDHLVGPRYRIMDTFRENMEEMLAYCLRVRWFATVQRTDWDDWHRQWRRV